MAIIRRTDGRFSRAPDDGHPVRTPGKRAAAAVIHYRAGKIDQLGRPRGRWEGRRKEGREDAGRTRSLLLNRNYVLQTESCPS